MVAECKQTMSTDGQTRPASLARVSPLSRRRGACTLSNSVHTRLAPTTSTLQSPQERVPRIKFTDLSYPILSPRFIFFFWENLLPNRNRLFENNLVEILYNFVVVKVSRIEFNVNVQRFVNMILKNDTCIYMIVFSLER